MTIQHAGVGLRTREAQVGPELSRARWAVRSEWCDDLANAEEATAAVMRYGCQRGEIFEGCERAVGKDT